MLISDEMAAEFVKVFGANLDYYMAGSLSCGESNTMAAMLRELGADKYADALDEAHAEMDDEDCNDHEV